MVMQKQDNKVSKVFIFTVLRVGFVLLCVLFLVYSSEVFSQIVSEETLDFLEKQRSPELADAEKVAEDTGTTATSDITFRDPFDPQIFKSKKEEKIEVEQVIEIKKQNIAKTFSLSVQGIIWNTDTPVVIINNQVLRKGEALLVKKDNAVEKITILDIDKEGVTVGYWGQEEKIYSPGVAALRRISGTRK